MRQHPLQAGLSDITVVDSRGIVHTGRDDLNEVKGRAGDPDKSGRPDRRVAEALRDADVFLGVSAGKVPEEIIATMAPNSIVFACSNPDPEIHPDIARRHAAIVATGRSDFRTRSTTCSPSPASSAVLSTPVPGASPEG